MKIDWKSFKKHWERPKKGEFPTGSVIYKGFQGSGKTLSLTHDALELLEKYPKAIMFTNLIIKTQNHDLNKRIIHYKTDKELKKALEIRCPNGMIVVIDEAHLFFNKKTGISLDVLTAISQQRKDRRRLMMTCQIWEDLDISLRKQVKEVINCRCVFKKFQINNVSDGETITWDNRNSCYTAKSIETRIFKHSDELYKCYDTRQKIVNNQAYDRKVSNNRYFQIQQVSNK